MTTIWNRKRQASGLSKTDMANELGLTVNYYGAIERGDVKMPSNLIDKFNEIINRGKQNEITNIENRRKADEFWKQMSEKNETGRFKLVDKMHDFNINNYNILVELLGYKSVGTLYNYLEGRNPVGDEFKKRLYAFFSDEKNIQIPKKEIKRQKYKINNTPKQINKELENYYKKTDFKKIMHDNCITNVEIANAVGVHNSTISNMTCKKYKPSYNIISKVKEYLDNALTTPTVEIPKVEIPEVTFPELPKNFNEFTPCEEKKNVATSPKESNVIARYRQELDEINDIIDLYKAKVRDMEIRKKICVEVLDAINELTNGLEK